MSDRGLEWLAALGPHRMRPGLARTRALSAGLGEPDRSFRSVLVGGTNGKGSTAATLSSILTAGGVRTGLYTSPHLLSVTERFRVNETDVSDPALDDVLALLAAVSPPHDPPTYFEALTVAAFELFRRARVEIAVLEVGLGGLLDATNVVEPELSIVTNVGLDHLEVLGPALADVARQKAGILRRGRPALTAASGEALAVLREEAARAGAHLVEVPPTGRFDGVTPLPGAHQRSNLALAAAAARAFGVDDATVERGVAATRWPGRLQRVARPGRRELLVDGAHNPDGARALAAHLDAEALSGRCDLVFGGLKDKDLPALFAELEPRAARVILVAPESERAESAPGLAARLGRPDLETAPSLEAALDRLDAAPREKGVPIIVTGSLYLVATALRLARGAGARR